MDFLSKYNKFIVAIVAALVALVTIYFGAEPWVPVLINFLGAIGVYIAPNRSL